MDEQASCRAVPGRDHGLRTESLDEARYKAGLVRRQRGKRGYMVSHTLPPIVRREAGRARTCMSSSPCCYPLYHAARLSLNR